MPTERERAEQIAQWRRDGSPSLFSGWSCNGCFWFVIVVMMLGLAIPACCGGGSALSRCPADEGIISCITSSIRGALR